MIEDCVGWGLETSPEVLTVEFDSAWPTRAAAEEWCRAIASPVLAIHGDQDHISPITQSERIVELTGGELVILEGSGHIPLARDPIKVNHLIADFVDRVYGAVTTSHDVDARPEPIETCALLSRHRSASVMPGVTLRSPKSCASCTKTSQIDWLAQHPVTRVLEDAGESVHPASDWLASESGHVESESGEHDLHCFEALRRMDEILVNNFHVFDDVVRRRRLRPGRR